MTGQVSGAALYRLGQRARGRALTLLVSRGFHQWGKGTAVMPPLRLDGERWIALGSGVYLGAGCWLRASPLSPATAPVIEIGDDCGFAGGNVISAVSAIRIGNGVGVARNVYIADHDHHYADPSRPIRRQGVTNVRPVIIDDGAWLGQNVVVTAGVRIGRGAVVGAGAVVTRDVPDYSLAVGVPATVIRSWAPAAARPAAAGLRG